MYRLETAAVRDRKGRWFISFSAKLGHHDIYHIVNKFYDKLILHLFYST